MFVGARLFHVAAVALLAAVGVGLGSDVFYWLGRRSRSRACCSTSTRSCGPGTCERLDAAFFTVNGLIAVVFFVFVALDTLT